MRQVAIKAYGLEFGDLQRRGKTDAIVVHHTGSPLDDDCSAKQIHTSHQAQGWSGIGYHYVVRKDGTIEQGRPHWVIGAHAYGDNAHTIGIHLSGNFEIGYPSQRQIESTALLIEKLCEDYGLIPDAEHVLGHSDLRGDTVCPGRNLHALLQMIRGKAIWYQQNFGKC